MNRWRLFEFRMPRAALSIATLEKFRHPTPRLEQLVLIGPDAPDEDSVSLPENFNESENIKPRRYFPVCPLLNWYDSSWTNIFINAAAPTQPLPKLRKLFISVSTEAVLWLWEALRAVPALEDLCVWIHHDQDAELDDPIPIPSSHLELPRLVELGVDLVTGEWFSLAADMLRMPSLREFNGPAKAMETLGSRFFDGPGKDIVTLRIQDDTLFKEDAASTQLVPSVQTLLLDRASLADEFFEPLLAPNAAGVWLLPRLNSLELRECTPESNNPFGELLVQLLRVRTAERGGNTPACLVTCMIDEATDLRDFHRAEIDYLLRSSKIEDNNADLAEGLLLDGDTVDLLGVVEGMVEDEDEAVMTDGGTDESDSSGGETPARGGSSDDYVPSDEES